MSVVVAAQYSMYAACHQCQERVFDGLILGSHLGDLVRELGLKQDRAAVEHEGAIVSRPAWPETPLTDSAKVEIVHFAGGGSKVQ